MGVLVGGAGGHADGGGNTHASEQSLLHLFQRQAAGTPFGELIEAPMLPLERIRIKRVYEPRSHTDGTRILVERLWPRGMTKADLMMDGWMKEVAPGPELRRWYGHDQAKWSEFRRRYVAELDHSGAWKPLLDLARTHTLTLLYSARGEERTSAAVLRDYLLRRMRAGRPGGD